MTGRPPALVHVTTTDISLELLLGPHLSAFVDAGYRVYGASAPGPFVERIEARGVTHLPLAHATRSMRPTEDARALAELTRLFRGLRPDIVHTHNPKPGLYGRLAARAAGVPVVVNTVHGLYAVPEDPPAKRAVVYSLERLASTCSDAELVQNPEDVATLRRHAAHPGRQDPAAGQRHRHGPVRAPPGPGPAPGRRHARRWGVGDGDVVVGAVGRLVLEKGYAELFSAWSLVRRDHPDAVLVVVGPEDDAKADALTPEVRARAVAEGVRFLGMRDDVEDLYPGLDLYVLASHREGFPRSAMEAAAAGLPIVATDIRGCRQVVEDGVTGLLVPARTVEPLATAIGSLVADGERRSRMAAAAGERALRLFDQQQQIDTTLATYRELLDRPAGRRWRRRSA